MRIISKFSDYYDNARAYGIDTTLVYVRQTRRIKLKDGRYYGNSPWNEVIPGEGVWTKTGVLGFCGKIYPYYAVSVLRKDTIVRWNFEDALSTIRAAIPGWGEWAKKSWGKKPGYERYELQNLRGVFKHPHSDLLETFHKYQVPVFCKELDGVLTLNPRLDDLQFYRVIPPYQAFQEISMYVGGVLNRSGNAPVEISDEIRAEKHGFDKNSFRRIPGSGPKRKQRKND